MRTILLLITLLYITLSHAEMNHAGMRMGEWGMVMNENIKQLPQGCDKVVAVKEVTIKAGREYAKEFPGTIFGYSQHEFSFPKCTRINFTFINEDDIRHQFMIHGLPTYLHPQGMFHMELYGKGEVKGSFITPNSEETYLAHCDVAQHMEKGMKAQVKVAGGSGDLPSIPGISGQINKDSYEFNFGGINVGITMFLLLVGFVLSMFVFVWRSK